MSRGATSISLTRCVSMELENRPTLKGLNDDYLDL